MTLRVINDYDERIKKIDLDGRKKILLETNGETPTS